jgi:uncharacterized membrane protein YkvA (DUF1232 family)
MKEQPDRIRPDELIPPDGGSSMQASLLAKDAVLMLPNLIKLVGRLLKDPRVPRRSKVALGLAAAYVASPIDLVPEFIPVIGWADDVLFILFAIDSLIERSGPEVVAEHWDGPGDLLAMIREVTGVVRNIVPKRLSQALDRIFG